MMQNIILSYNCIRNTTFFFLESEVETKDEAIRTKDKNVETEGKAN